jgi:hypothetical protein
MYVRRPFGPNRTTSHFSGPPPSIPGEPIGMPETAGPVAFGFSKEPLERHRRHLLLVLVSPPWSFPICHLEVE